MRTCVLVIDDERPTLKMFRLLLQAYGYGMLEAESGQEGLAVFARERPSLVITDVKMPGTDGLQVLREIKAMDPTVEVIVMTGHGDMDLTMQCLHLGAADFLAKPITRKDLETALTHATRRLEKTHSSQWMHVEEKGQAVVLKLQGNINSPPVDEFQKIMAQALASDTKDLVFWFDQSTSVNDQGLNLLAEAVKSAQREGKKVSIAGLSANFQGVFENLGLMREVRMHEDLASALSSF